MKGKNSFWVGASCALLIGSGVMYAPITFAQGGNDFFGSSVPSGGGGQGGSSIDRPPGVQAAEQQALQSQHSGDFTADEKRMQKKFKANLRAAQDLVTKAEKMMKEGEKRKDDKMAKKGKILKEVAEKRVTELKESNPVQ